MLPVGVHPEPGRIVATTKSDKVPSVTADGFPVLMSDEFFSTNVDKTRNNGMRNTTQYGGLRLCVTEGDAMKESAYLVGKREGELPEMTATRRARSTGGQTFRMNGDHMGRLGIGASSQASSIRPACAREGPMLRTPRPIAKLGLRR